MRILLLERAMEKHNQKEAYNDLLNSLNAETVKELDREQARVRVREKFQKWKQSIPKVCK